MVKKGLANHLPTKRNRNHGITYSVNRPSKGSSLPLTRDNWLALKLPPSRTPETGSMLSPEPHYRKLALQQLPPNSHKPTSRPHSLPSTQMSMWSSDWRVRPPYTILSHECRSTTTTRRHQRCDQTYFGMRRIPMLLRTHRTGQRGW